MTCSQKEAKRLSCPLVGLYCSLAGALVPHVKMICYGPIPEILTLQKFGYDILREGNPRCPISAVSQKPSDAEKQVESDDVRRYISWWMGSFDAGRFCIMQRIVVTNPR